MSDIITELGSLAFASRLRRLSDRLMRDVARIYDELAVTFEPRWFPLLYLLHRQKVMSVTDAARALGLTHPAVNQIAGAMMRAGLLSAAKDRTDERRRMLRLTKQGEKIHRELTTVWQEIEGANRELLAETGADILGLLADLEQRLDRQDMYARIRARLPREKETAQIVEYRPAYRKAFAELNLEWLEESFDITKSDRSMLADPEAHILESGGTLFFAKSGRRIVGTCALLRRGPHLAELAHLAVSAKLRGRGIGRQLAEHAIAFARSRHDDTLMLYTSPKLAAAVSLYNSLGFVEAPSSDRGPYPDCRCPLHMRLDLKSSGVPR